MNVKKTMIILYFILLSIDHLQYRHGALVVRDHTLGMTGLGYSGTVYTMSTLLFEHGIRY